MVLPDKLEEEIARLDEAASALLSCGQKISLWLDPLLESNENLAVFRDKKQRFDRLFSVNEESLPIGKKNKMAEVQEQLRQSLPDLDLKFTGGKKGAKSNRELAVEKILTHLESLWAQVNDLEKNKQEKYLATPAGRAQAEQEVENRARCRQEVLRTLVRFDDLEKISQLKISPRHLELAGVYGVELVQDVILNEWKKMAAKLLLEQHFSGLKDQINSFRKYQDSTADFSNHQKEFLAVKEAVAELKTLEDQTVLLLADILAQNQAIKQRFRRYGIRGASLGFNIQSVLTAYDDLPVAMIVESPAALAYEYLHHLLQIGTGTIDSQGDPLTNLENLFYFRDAKGRQSFGADVFGQKYSAANFNFFNAASHDPHFLLALSGQLKQIILTLQAEIRSEGLNINPRLFLARFGQENYSLLRSLPDLVAAEAKVADFPEEYMEAHGAFNKKYYEAENAFNRFDTWSRQLAEKLSGILAIRWLEEELRQKYQNNPEIWAVLNDKIQLMNYLKFLEQNKKYHAKQLIAFSINAAGQLELLDRAGRQAEADKQVEFAKLEGQYKEYLKGEITALISEINHGRGKIFSRRTLNDRLGTCQILSSHSLLDRIYNRISGLAVQSFKESSLSSKELSHIKDFVAAGYDNLQVQKEIRGKYQAAEKDLNRSSHKLDAAFWLEYPDLTNNILTYENLISHLKLINVALASRLREKHSGLIQDFGVKLKQYQNLVADYNRLYQRGGDSHAIPVIDFSEDLTAYL
jgi:hypothetical protein